jgi:hypothetical protein
LQQNIAVPLTFLLTSSKRPDGRINNGTLIKSEWFPKVGNRNLRPKYCGQPKRLRTKKKAAAPAIADLQNLTSAIPQHSAVSGQFSYFLVTSPQLSMFVKICQK